MKPEHEAAEQALREQRDVYGGTERVFSRKVDDYRRSRPDYPDAMFDALLGCGALFPGAVVADLGAGTGILSAQLLERGHSVIAVEPDDQMRAAADARLCISPRYSSCSGSAESTLLERGSVDLACAAQAFHWFDALRTRIECLRILKPTGKVALIWNDRASHAPLNEALEPVLDRYGDTRRLATRADAERRHVPFFFGDAPFDTLRFEHRHRIDRNGLFSLVFSRSYMPARDSDSGRRALDELQRIFDLFATEGVIAMEYSTVMILGRPAV